MKKILSIIKALFITVLIGAMMLATLFSGYIITLFILVISIFGIIYTIISISSFFKNIKPKSDEELKKDRIEKFIENYKKYH